MVKKKDLPPVVVRRPKPEYKHMSKADVLAAERAEREAQLEADAYKAEIISRGKKAAVDKDKPKKKKD